MPIMKVNDFDGTHYVPHPHRVVEIHDAFVNEPVTGKQVAGCSVVLGHHTLINVAGQSALKMKRSIQENTEQDIGFLKLEFSTTKIPKGLRFVNLDHVIELRVKNPQQPTTFGTALVLDSDQIGDPHDFDDYSVHLTGDYRVVALQMRRVINRLDQDESLCCAAPPEPKPDPPAEAEAE